MKKIYFLLLTVMFLGALNSNAQVNTYQWSALTGLTYTELTGGTVINTDAQLSTGTIGASADDGAVLITLPFTFTFNGVGYTQVTMCTNGWVGMGNQLGITPAQGRAAGNLFTNVVPNNLIGGWFGDGSANFPAPNPGSMVYGPRGTDVFVFEWKSATGNGFTASTTNLISFQIVIYGPGSTSPGRIETLYGAATGTPSTGRTIGLGGTGTDFINGLTGSTTSTATAAAWPGNGNGFRFNPAPPCVAPTSLAATVSVTPATTTVSGSFTAAATAPSGYLVVRTTSNVAPVPVAGTNYTVGSSPIGYIEYVNTAAGSWTSTSLTATTQYYYWIFSYNNTLCAGGPLYSSTATTTSTTTLAAGAITSVGTGGLWSAPGTWSTGAVPTANDAVTIAAGSPVTIDIAALAYSLTVNGSLTYEAATARTLTVSTDVTVNAGGTFGTAASGTVTTHSLSLAGNLVNDGVIDFSIATAATNVVFTGLTNSTFSGAGAVTDLAGLSLSKTTRDIIVELNLSNFSVGGLSTASTGTLLTSNTGTGTLKISGTNTFSGTLWSVPAYTIPATLGIWLNNPNFTVTGLTGSATLAGLFRISQGTYGIGTAAGNSLGFSTGAIVTIEGGNVVAAGRFGVGAAANVITYTQTGGAILVSTAGNVSTTLASFDLGTGLTSTISITGGTITVQTASTAGSGPRDYRVQSGVGLDAVTGGTVFIGNAATTANSIFNVTGIFPDLVLTNTSGSHSTIFGTVANYNHAARNVTINTGDSLNLSNNPFLFAGTAFVNNGKLTHNGASSRFITFRANTNMTYSGTGTVTAPMTSLELQNDLNFTFDPAVNNVVANRVIIFNGNFVNANKITLGNGGTTSAIIQYGNTTTPTAGGNFDVAPTFNLGTGGQSISYLRTTNPKTTGVEINPSRILTNLSVDDNVNVLNVAGGDLTVTGTFSMTNGNIINGTNLITLGTSTSAGTLSHGASNPFITGSFARTFRAGRTASSLYSDSTKYPVGKGSAYLPFYFDPTVSASGAITLTAEAFASNTGTPGSGVTNLANVRWQTSAINGGANLTGAFLSIGQSGIVSTSKILQATSGAGVYVELPGGSDLFAGTPNTLRSNSAVAAANYTGFLSYGDFQPACPSPSAVTVSATTGTTASVSFTGSGPFILEYGTPGFTPGIDNNAGGGTIITSATSPITITGLSPLTTYQVYVRANCSGTGNGYSNNSSPVSFTTTLINDQAPGAISLAVNAGCTGAIYTNVGASASAGENFPSCSGARFTPVWFSFVAPATGAVRVSTDYAGGTFTDSKVALFSATNAADSTTFNIISCDDDNGSVVGSGFLSVLYATGLTPGITYYIAVDKFGASTTAGTFCITVDELATSMLATTNTCASTYQTPGGAVSTYKGWVPLTDGSSRLVALVRNPAGGSVGSYTVSQNVNTGAIRQSASSSVFYLDRNFRIANTTATNVDVQLFFLTSEMAALTTADGTTLSQLAVTRQTETVAGCQNNYLESNGPSIVIPQTSNGTSNNVDWIQFTTPGFSNFYLNKVGTVLPIAVEYFTGAKQATGNSLNWKVNCNASASAVMVLERSADGVRFTAINSRTETSLRCLQPFNHIDAVPVAGMNYYRLKTVDVDGRVAYSNIVAILNREKGIEIVSMIPNPVKDMATLSIASATISKMDIIVSDVAGKQLMKQSVVLSAGSNTVPLNLAHLAAGTYQVTGYTAEGKVKTMRFVKQ